MHLIAIVGGESPGRCAEEASGVVFDQGEPWWWWRVSEARQLRGSCKTTVTDAINNLTLVP